MKVPVGTFNQEKALVGVFSVIVKTDVSFAALPVTDGSFAALPVTLKFGVLVEMRSGNCGLGKLSV